MDSRTVIKTSVFSSGKADIFCRLQELKTLQFIAAPYATFTPAEGAREDMIWEEGRTFAFKFKLFGVIPLGIHTIKVIRFSEENGIYTHEGNPSVPLWNHRIILKAITEESTQYTDEVEINAGWKTDFVYLWAKAFYSHRQRKWKKLLRYEGKKKP